MMIFSWGAGRRRDTSPVVGLTWRVFIPLVVPLPESLRSDRLLSPLSIARVQLYRASTGNPRDVTCLQSN
jgi:hypothetical protein